MSVTLTDNAGSIRYKGYLSAYPLVGDTEAKDFTLRDARRLVGQATSVILSSGNCQR